jgi:RHS repeat-associated protein
LSQEDLDSNGNIFTETEFDAVGRPKRSTNPYRANEAKVWTTTNYDVQGRPFEIVTSDGAKVTTAFGLSTTGNAIGTTVTVTDQANKQRRSITNALGQLTRVDEPNDAGNLGTLNAPTQPTSYIYDTLDNLITVNQGVQTRSFAYDSLSRLKQANNPESGIINYIYDNNSNLTSKTDARQIVTNYVYDNLNRVKNRNYSDNITPNVAYTYDNLPNAKGKLIKVNSSVSTTDYTSFDILGRVQNHKQRTDNNDYTTAYTYNLSGALIEETYPSGRVVKNTLDVDGDLAQVQSKKLNDTFKNYANAFTYTSAGAVSSLRLGNGKFENTTFNSRLQPIQIGLGSSATSQNLLKLNFDYGVADNNGNVKSQQITVQQGNPTPLVLNQNYVYDSLNRLKSAEEKDANNIQVWKQTYVFDRYGNRNFDATNNNTTNLVGTLPKVTNPEILPSNNRLKADQDGDNVADYLYDASGNLTKDVDNKRFGYDAENKQVQYFAANNQTTTPNGTYFFDGDGKRVKKISPTETTIFVYDAGGKLVAEYSTQQADTPKINYTSNDHLGSPRITTDQNGQVISRTDYQPYGEEIASTQRTANLGYTVQDSVKQGFTGYIKDDETGLDFAQARMYKNSLGRFTGADPLLSSAHIKRPQSWNRYGYVMNNPLVLIDPSGLYVCGGTEKQCKQFEDNLQKAQIALGKLDKKSDHYKLLERAIGTYGKAGVNNGLTVAFGKVKPGAAAETTGRILDKNEDGKKDITTDNPTGRDLTITFDDKLFGSNNNSIVNMAHEGSHAADRTDFIAALPVDSSTDEATKMFASSPLNLSSYQTEHRAYTVSAATSNGLGFDDLTVDDKEVWNSGWKKADMAEMNSKQSRKIDEYLSTSKLYGDGKGVAIDRQGKTFY